MRFLVSGKLPESLRKLSARHTKNRGGLAKWLHVLRIQLVLFHRFGFFRDGRGVIARRRSRLHSILQLPAMPPERKDLRRYLEDLDIGRWPADFYSKQKGLAGI
jgi:hypothetical protein